MAQGPGSEFTFAPTMLPPVQAAGAQASCLQTKIDDAIYDIQSNTQFLSPKEAAYRDRLETAETHLKKALEYLALVKVEIGKAAGVITAATTVSID